MTSAAIIKTIAIEYGAIVLDYSVLECCSIVSDRLCGSPKLLQIIVRSIESSSERILVDMLIETGSWKKARDRYHDGFAAFDEIVSCV